MAYYIRSFTVLVITASLSNIIRNRLSVQSFDGWHLHRVMTAVVVSIISSILGIKQNCARHRHRRRGRPTYVCCVSQLVDHLLRWKVPWWTIVGSGPDIETFAGDTLTLCTWPRSPSSGLLKKPGSGSPWGLAGGTGPRQIPITAILMTRACCCATFVCRLPIVYV